jgi:hypothetical protein
MAHIPNWSGANISIFFDSNGFETQLPMQRALRVELCSTQVSWFLASNALQSRRRSQLTANLFAELLQVVIPSKILLAAHQPLILAEEVGAEGVVEAEA